MSPPPDEIARNAALRAGFTLIELSVVLVIIGLIVGGVLVGQDLIKAAQVRAQITQIERYNTAVNTFRVKYGYLPGDIPNPDATTFGFAARGPNAGEGDGNGLLEGWNGVGASGSIVGNEITTFWSDLGTAGLIEGTFYGNPTVCDTVLVTLHPPSRYWPPAKLGQGNYVYGWSTNSTNLFGIAVPTGSTGACQMEFSAGLSVQQAYAIDAKIDDGFPQTGTVTAILPHPNTNYAWAGTNTYNVGPYTTATAGSAGTCFDNSSAGSGTPGVGGAIQHYSLEISSGSNVNCALSFQFQ